LCIYLYDAVGNGPLKNERGCLTALGHDVYELSIPKIHNRRDIKTRRRVRRTVGSRWEHSMPHICQSSAKEGLSQPPTTVQVIIFESDDIQHEEDHVVSEMLFSKDDDNRLVRIVLRTRL